MNVHVQERDVVRAGSYVIEWENTKSGSPIYTPITVDKDLSLSEFEKQFRMVSKKTGNGDFDKFKNKNFTMFSNSVIILPFKKESEGTASSLVDAGYEMTVDGDNMLFVKKSNTLSKVK